MDMDAIAARVKAKREAAGLKSIYTTRDGLTYERYHANEAQKAYNDFKYALRAKYPTKADVPKEDLARLDALYASTWPRNAA